MTRAPLLVAMLAVALAPSALAQDAQPLVDASQYRFDLGTMLPGAQTIGSFELHNAGAIPAAVELESERADSYLTLSRATLTLVPGERAAIDFAYRVPSDAAPGDHGEALRIKVAPLSLLGAPASGSLDAGTAILFTSRAASAGLLAIEAPEIVAPGEGATGRVLAVNTDARPATLTARLDLVDADGATLATRALGTLTLAPDASGAWEYAFAASELAPGEHTLRATLAPADPAGPLVSLASFEKPLVVGERAALFEILDVADDGEGVATFNLRIKNTGTVPATLHPVLTIRSAAGGTATGTLDAIELLPGEEREIVASLDVPPGAWTASLTDRPVDGILVRTSGDERAFTMAARAPAPDGAPDGAAWIRIAGLITFGAFAAVGATALVVPRLRRRAPRVTRAPRAPLAFRAPEAAPVAQAPARASAIASATGLALLVDLDSLGADAPLVEILRVAAPQEPPARAIGYRSAASQKAAAKTYLALQRAGFTPHVRVAESASTRQSHVALAMDAMEAAAEGASIVLATHDASYADLVRRLVARGAHVQALGVEGEVPVALLEAASGTILLPPRDPLP